MHRAKVFDEGDEQVVLLPEECWFDADEVSIRREGRAVILEPIEPAGPMVAVSGEREPQPGGDAAVSG